MNSVNLDKVMWRVKSFKGQDGDPPKATDDSGVMSTAEMARALTDS